MMATYSPLRISTSTPLSACTFSAPRGLEYYRGSISKFGVDIGYLQGGVIVWTVIAPTANPAPGSLSAATALSSVTACGIFADASFATGASTFHATDIALLLEQIAPGGIFPDDDFTVSLYGGVPLAELRS